jgi:hypothetical protein
MQRRDRSVTVVTVVVGDIMRWVAALVMSSVVLAAPLAAGISPVDQRRAERLTLRLADLGSGWKQTYPPSTQPRTSSCSTAPKIEGDVSGYSRSAFFHPTARGDFREASSTTRVFGSRASAKEWFAWAGGGPQAACGLKGEAAFFEQQGYRTSRLRYREIPLRPTCSRCSAMRAWHMSFIFRKPGERSDPNVPWEPTFSIDLVVVRSDRAVIGFILTGNPFTFGERDAKGAISRVMKRA